MKCWYFDLKLHETSTEITVPFSILKNTFVSKRGDVKK